MFYAVIPSAITAILILNMGGEITTVLGTFAFMCLGLTLMSSQRF